MATHWHNLSKTRADNRRCFLEGFLYNPDPEKDYTRLKRIAVGICLMFTIVIFILWFFNRKLAKEVVERKRVEKTLRDREHLLNEMGSLAKSGAGNMI